MNLVTLCEPLFQYVCLVNRMGRKGAPPDYSDVRNTTKELFQKMTEKAKGDVALASQYAQVELPLLFFVDSMFSEGPLPWAAEWNRKRMANDRDELAGDEKFFDLLQLAEAQPGNAADERLTIYYTCIGLGFSGWYSGQPEYLRRKMNDLLPRVRTFVDADEAGLVTPDTYQHTNTINLPLPMSARMMPTLIVVCGSILLLIAVNYFSFRNSSQEMNQALDSILSRDPAVSATAKDR
jgi:type VI protein secretion system component VasF